VVKSELVRALSKKLPELQPHDVELAVNCMLDQMSDALINAERIEVRGFGSFDLHHQPTRIARNPKTGESVNLPAKVKLHFKPGKEMRDRVNNSRIKCQIIKLL
jgi:integration host factor subunit beta